MEIIEKINGQRPKSSKKAREASVAATESDAGEVSSQPDSGKKPASAKTTCCVQGCMTNTSNWIGPKRSVFRVPKDPENRDKWLERIKVKDRPGHGKNNLSVCEAHFKKAFVVEHENRGDKRFSVKLEFIFLKSDVLF